MLYSSTQNFVNTSLIFVLFTGGLYTDAVIDMTDTELARLINADLTDFAERWKVETPEYSKDAVDAFCEVLLRGGKRLRGILALRSYYYCGGNDNEVAIAAARIFEILQTSLLLIDDIADRSELRRGGPSAHMILKSVALDHQLKGDAAHYGEVQAMNIAYAGPPKALNELLVLPVSDKIKTRTVRSFNNNVLTTISGQIDDVFNEVAPSYISVDAIESVLRRKTALYTFLSPLELGAQLAGQNELSTELKEYSLAAGCAFQIADDIISTFGGAKATGKEGDDDIHEGKVTLLARHALDVADAKDKKLLAETLGNAAASKADCDMVRRIFIKTGAVVYAHDRLNHYVQVARAALATSPGSPKLVAYLSGMVDYLEQSVSDN